MSTAFELVEAHPFLADLPIPELRQLAAWGHPVWLPAGARVFAEGGGADRFWLLAEGRVQLEMQLPGHGTAIIETLTSGTVLGWSWLFPPYRWQFDAIAVEPTLAVEFVAHSVRRLCDDDRALGYELMQRFMRVVIDRLQATRLRLLDLYRLP